MSVKTDHTEDQITFTLGVGSQSSICGGVKPMGIAGQKQEETTSPSSQDIDVQDDTVASALRTSN